MSQFKVTIPIKRLRDVIKEQNAELAIDQARFHFRGNELVGTVITHSPNEEEALKETLFLIEKSLSRICFAYNTEASVERNGYYLTNLSDDPHSEHVGRRLTLRWGYVKTEPNVTLSDLASITPANLESLDLALAYYRLGEYSNPLRLESLFSCMTVIARSLLSKEFITTAELKSQIKTILKQNNPNFVEQEFDRKWNDCYADERCSIAHGRGSKLVDPRKSLEYDDLVNKAGFWARELIYYYIDKFKQ